MSQYQFQIVWHGFGRYAWELVDVSGPKGVIIERSDRGYRSKKKVKSAITKLQKATATTWVVDTTNGDDPGLPHTDFRFLSDVDRLPVGRFVETPAAARRAGTRLAGGAARAQQRLRDQVARKAHAIYVAQGRKDGNDVAHWLQAQQEVILERAYEYSQRRSGAPDQHDDWVKAEADVLTATAGQQP